MRRLLPILVCVAFVAAGCAGSDSSSTEDFVTTTTAETSTKPAVDSTSTATTTQVPPTTSTSVMVTPTLPPELDATYPVVLTEGVTGTDTMDIAVWAPEADGLWPIAIVFHGLGAKGIHYAEMASLLASQGVVVFAPDYRATLIPTP